MDRISWVTSTDHIHLSESDLTNEGPGPAYRHRTRTLLDLEVVSAILMYSLSSFPLPCVDCEGWDQEKELAIIIIGKEERRKSVFIYSITSCSHVIGAFKSPHRFIDSAIQWKALMKPY